jgi:hypothetical protein
MAQSNDTLVREFVEAFNTKDEDRLVPYLHPRSCSTPTATRKLVTG